MAMAKRNRQEAVESGQQSEPGGASYGDVATAPPRAVPSVSETLRQGRIKAGLSLNDVAELLCIRRVHLQAIEDGRFAELPGKVYAIGFVRSYADFLHLDGENLVQRFKREVSTLNTAPALVFPVPAPESRTPSGAIMLVALLMAGLAYGGWYYLSSEHRELAGLVPELPERFSTMLEDEESAPPVEQRDNRAFRPASARATEINPPATDDAVSPTGAVERAAPSAVGALGTSGPQVAALPSNQTLPDALSERDVAEPTTSGTDRETQASGRDTPAGPPPPPEDPAQGRHFGSATGDARIVIRATGLSYVEVLDRSSQRMWWKTLRPGESYGVPNMDGLQMVTGNAGALRIEVDGQVAPSVGEPGEVVRNISLEAGRLLAGTAVN